MSENNRVADLFSSVFGICSKKDVNPENGNSITEQGIENYSHSFFAGLESEDEMTIPDNAFFASMLGRIRDDVYGLAALESIPGLDNYSHVQDMINIKLNLESIVDANRVYYWSLHTLKYKAEKRKLAILTMYYLYRSIRNLKQLIQTLAGTIGLVHNVDVITASTQLGCDLALTLTKITLWKESIDTEFNISRDEIHDYLKRCTDLD